MVNLQNIRSLLLTAAALAAVPAAAGAQTAPGVDFTPPGNFVQDNSGFTLGYQFTANAGAVVVGLATWADWATTPGVAMVGLWTAAGSLVASARVTTESPTIGAAPWAYAPIVPVALTPGAAYVVGSFGADANESALNAPLTVDPRINFIIDAYVSSTTLQFPSQSSFFNADEGGGYFGGNVILGAASPAIPEPSTWAMTLAGFAALALIGRGGSRRSARAAG